VTWCCGSRWRDYFPSHHPPAPRPLLLLLLLLLAAAWPSAAGWLVTRHRSHSAGAEPLPPLLPFAAAASTGATCCTVVRKGTCCSSWNSSANASRYRCTCRVACVGRESDCGQWAQKLACGCTCLTQAYCAPCKPNAPLTTAQFLRSALRQRAAASPRHARRTAVSPCCRATPCQKGTTGTP